LFCRSNGSTTICTTQKEGKGSANWVVRYPSGSTTPDGEFEYSLNFKKGKRLDVEATSFDWMVVTGARANFKGTADISIDNTFEGSDFTFIVMAIDGDIQPIGDGLPDDDGFGGDEIDRFRLVIIRNSNGDVVYDTERGTEIEEDLSPSLEEDGEILSGSIVVHRAVGGQPVGNAPTVSINQPPNNSLFDASIPEVISFDAVATDVEDDNIVLTASISWSSSIDGGFGTGGSFTRTADQLSNGMHTITASVTDSDGNSDTSSVQIDIVSSPGPTNVISIVDPLDFSTKAKGKHLLTTITIQDSLLQGVFGAQVFYELELVGTGIIDSKSGFTDGAGEITFQDSNTPAGDLIARVTSVTPPGTDVFDGILVQTPLTKDLDGTLS